MENMEWIVFVFFDAKIQMIIPVWNLVLITFS